MAWTTWSTAWSNAISFALEGLGNPLYFRRNT
jgi:hypothetical protein